MSTPELLDIVVGIRDSSRQVRINAIRRLAVKRSRAKEKSSAGPLPGQDELKEVMRNPNEHIDVRCHAAAVAAQTDNPSALDWCRQMLLEPTPPPFPMSTGQPLVWQFLESASEEILSSSSRGDVLVVNTAREIPMQITFGPFLNPDGLITMHVELDIDTLEVDVDEYETYLDLLFLPTSQPELLGSFRITCEAELRLRAPLPDSPEVRDFLTRIRETGEDLIHLSQKAFAFRIWWREA